MLGGYCSLPLPRTLTCAPRRSHNSTASKIRCASSLSATHSRKSGGKNIGVCRSTFTKRSAMEQLLTHPLTRSKVRQSRDACATQENLQRFASHRLLSKQKRQARGGHK